MANPTTNYGFVLPTSSDLVTDLPADFDVALQGVDTRLKALQPGTTLGDLAYSSATANTNTRLPIGTNGQVLAVVAGVPAWQNGTTGDIEGVTAGVGISGGGTSGTVTVTNSMATAITTAGDLIKGTGAGTFDRLGIGSTGQVLTVSSGAPAWVTPAGGGKVLQVVMGTATGYTSNSTSTYADTGLSASITPSSSTSKVLVLVSQNGCGKETNNTNCVIKLMRDATDLLTISKIGYDGTTGTRSGFGASASYLDSPATTSATTYKTRFMSVNNNAKAWVQDYDSGYPTMSTIMLLEIGA
jgi:hypothetical protein